MEKQNKTALRLALGPIEETQKSIMSVANAAASCDSIEAEIWAMLGTVNGHLRDVVKLLAEQERDLNT